MIRHYKKLVESVPAQVHAALKQKGDIPNTEIFMDSKNRATF